MATASKSVAICIASYNHAKYLPELFQCIDDQTYRDFEVYIGYDGSTDDSLTVIEIVQRHYGFPIHVLDYDETARIGYNKHRIVEFALKNEPDIIQMLDSDDLIKPTFLERSVATIAEYDWLISWGEQFGTREGKIEGYITPLEEHALRNTIHSWGMFKAHCLRKHNYDPDLAFAEDWNLWLRLRKSGYKGVVLQEHLYQQRWHDTNLTTTRRSRRTFAEIRGEVTKDLNFFSVKRPYRFHLLGLVHLPISEEYMACAFTQKVVKMAKMLVSLGHEVFLYGAEGSDAPCTEFIQTHTLEDIRDEWGSGDNRFDIGYNWKRFEFRHDFNKERAGVTQDFYKNVATAINQRKYEDDFLLLMQGSYHRPVADQVGLYLTLEPGIGYRGSIKGPLPYTQGPFRAFESAYLQNFTYGGENPGQSINGFYYDRVIPNYFEAKDFPYQAKKGDYFFYIGRMIGRKGVRTAIDATQAIGAKLILAGQTDPEIAHRYLPPHCEFIGYVGPEQRAKLMGGAKAVFVPTIYLEAFGGVNVEAQLCGTPAITTNFGVFPETVIHGVTGYRCNTMEQFVNAAKSVDKLKPNKIRKHAERYLTDNIKWEFQEWFDDLYQLYLSAVEPRWRGRGWSYIP
jgi:glycosyltransferase involved in cell wall biosynthesis